MGSLARTGDGSAPAIGRGVPGRAPDATAHVRSVRARDGKGAARTEPARVPASGDAELARAAPPPRPGSAPGRHSAGIVPAGSGCGCGSRGPRGGGAAARGERAGERALARGRRAGARAGGGEASSPIVRGGCGRPRIGVIPQERAFFPAVATRTSGIGARRASGKSGAFEPTRAAFEEFERARALMSLFPHSAG